MNQQLLLSLWDAPAALLDADGHCGLLAAWVVLRYFRRRTSAARLLRATGFVPSHGVFSVALACALHEHGLLVHFYTDPDQAIDPAEAPFYDQARRAGILFQPAATIDVLLSHLAAGHIPIVLYDAPDGEAHFSILSGATARTVQFHDETGLSRRAFERAWNTPGTLRQSVVVGPGSRITATPNQARQNRPGALSCVRRAGRPVSRQGGIGGVRRGHAQFTSKSTIS